MDVFNVSERVKLKRSDYPLVLRIMQGPCEQVCKVFLMEEDLGEEVTYDVNHHIHFNVFCKGARETEKWLPAINEHVSLLFSILVYVPPASFYLPHISLSVFLCFVIIFLLPSTRWRSISSLKCLSCRVSSPNWRRRRTERCRSSGEGTRKYCI